MPKGQTRSNLTLGRRRAKAFELFAKGYNAADVARKLNVSENTGKSYFKLWNSKIQEQARENPALLRDVLSNTFKALEELDVIKKEAWKDYKKADSYVVRNQIRTNMISIQKQRAALLGLVGVKAEVLAHMNHVQAIQTRMLDFMRRELCAEDKEKVARFIESDLMSHMEQVERLQIPATVINSGDSDDEFEEL